MYQISPKMSIKRRLQFVIVIFVVMAINFIVNNKYHVFRVFQYTRSINESLLRYETNSTHSVGRSLAMFQPVLTTAGSENYRIFPNIGCHNHDVTLFIGVPTSRENFVARKAIRETWGQYKDTPGKKTLLLFFVGSEIESVSESLQTNSTQQLLNYEAKEFGGIVQDHYIDSFRNLTLKTLSIVKWVLTYCPQSPFILKADDDMYINVPLLIEELTIAAKLPGHNGSFVFGQLTDNFRPIRNTNSKWYVNFSEYAETLYPQFVFGTAYSMSTAAARRLYEASLTVPFFYLEDVYFTGLCRRRSRVPIIHSDKFSNGKVVQSGCTFRNRISGHWFSRDDMIRVHRELNDEELKCG